MFSQVFFFTFKYSEKEQYTRALANTHIETLFKRAGVFCFKSFMGYSLSQYCFYFQIFVQCLQVYRRGLLHIVEQEGVREWSVKS